MYYCHGDNQSIKTLMICDTSSQTWLFKKYIYILRREESVIFLQVILLEIWESLVQKKDPASPSYQLCGIRQITILENETVTPIPSENPPPPKRDLKTKYRYVAYECFGNSNTLYNVKKFYIAFPIKDPDLNSWIEKDKFH